MKSSFDITSGVLQVLRPLVQSTITGDVYLQNEPKGDEKENIVVNSLANPVEYLQEATINVNIHVEKLDQVTADLGKTKEILDLITPALDDQYHLVGDVTLHLTIADDKGFFEDRDEKSKTFYNLRIRCITI